MHTAVSNAVLRLSHESTGHCCLYVTYVFIDQVVSARGTAYCIDSAMAAHDVHVMMYRNAHPL